MKTKAEVLKKNQLTDVLLVIAVLGSLWGLSEVVLSGAIRMTGIPFRAGILAGIGIGLIAVAVGAFMRMGIILLIPIIAVLCKQLVVPILGVSVMCKVNSCVAVMLEGFAVTRSRVPCETKTGGESSDANSMWNISCAACCRNFLFCGHAAGSVQLFIVLQSIPWFCVIYGCRRTGVGSFFRCTLPFGIPDRRMAARL